MLQGGVWPGCLVCGHGLALKRGAIIAALSLNMNRAHSLRVQDSFSNGRPND